MGRPVINILIGGEAGQGLVTVGQLLTKSLIRSGYDVVVTQTYQSRIRGGHNTFAIRAAGHALAAPQESIDLLIAFDEATPGLHRPQLSESGLLLLDEKGDGGGLPSLKIPYGDLAGPRYENSVALGVAGCLLGLEEDLIAGAVHDMFGARKPEAAEDNRRALAGAFRWASEQSVPFEGLTAASGPSRRLMMNGNEAVALGALAAGVKFCAFYPMTPSTSIALTLSRYAGQAGVVVEQVEDEIAAVNMAIGASFAGAPSIVTTSGGGFALMTEGVSLAAMTETPVVIAVAQRPGPATGLPTRTEQGDLEFVLHSGHGEFPRVILAPGSVEECFHLTGKAFEWAESSQGPVFILTDQFLADSYRAVEPFDVPRGEPHRREEGDEKTSSPYRRYTLTESGVSPRALPGMSGKLVVADSDEHSEEGHITEDLPTREKMVEKRLKKAEALQKSVIPPLLSGGEGADLLLVSWGSTKGAVEEAAGKLRAGGRRTATLHFSQLWPLDGEQFLPALQGAGRVVAVEGNATGQLARLIRRETGFEIRENVLRYDGLPLTTEYILDALPEG